MRNVISILPANQVINVLVVSGCQIALLLAVMERLSLVKHVIYDQQMVQIASFQVEFMQVKSVARIVM